jgi:hypothetical protein
MPMVVGCRGTTTREMCVRDDHDNINAATLYDRYQAMHRDIQYQIVHSSVRKAPPKAPYPGYGNASTAVHPRWPLDAVRNCQLHVP